MNRRLRILIASDHYPPFVGGVQRQTRALALEFAERGHEVCVATVWQDDLAAVETKDGFPVHRLRQLRTLPVITGRPRRRHQPPFPDPVTVWQLRRLIARFEPDVIHSSGWFNYAAAAAVLGKDVPLVASVREYGLSCANASMLHKGRPCAGPGLAKCLDCSVDYFGAGRGIVAATGVRLSAPLLRRKVAAIHSISRYVREVTRRDFLRGRSCDVPHAIIPSFRTPDDDAPDAEVLRELPDEPFLLFVGALRRVKGVGTLFDAYAQLRDAPPLVLLGTPESDTPTHVPPGARILGPANNATVLAAWDRSLFGIMPSLWPEPFGSVIHEAMSRGKAVIGTTPGGHEDMIEHGRTGLLIAPGNVAALHDAMRCLVDDANGRERMGARARLTADRFTAAVTIPQFEELYGSVS
jgi:glycosyltransferase involved in cell wall biosynthesis